MTDELWPGGPRFKEQAGIFRLSTDSILLAHFANCAPGKKRKHAIDLGCGSGIISVLLAHRDPALRIDGVEILPEAARLATENAALGGYGGRITIIEGDLRRHREFLQPGAYDLTISNPPYFACDSGKRPDDESSAAARGEYLCSLADVCSAAAYLTRWGGSFMLVHKPERLAEVFRAVASAGFEPKRVRFVQHNYKAPPCLVLIESHRGGKPSLSVEAPLILTNDDGSDSDEARSIYHRD